MIVLSGWLAAHLIKGRSREIEGDGGDGPPDPGGVEGDRGRSRRWQQEMEEMAGDGGDQREMKGDGRLSGARGEGLHTLEAAEGEPLVTAVGRAVEARAWVRARAGVGARACNEIMWRSYGDRTEITRRSYGDRMEIARRPHGDHVPGTRSSRAASIGGVPSGGARASVSKLREISCKEMEGRWREGSGRDGRLMGTPVRRRRWELVG